jgi:hypothetical protein
MLAMAAMAQQAAAGAAVAIRVLAQTVLVERVAPA